MAALTLDVVADPVCPWCHLGLESLKRVRRDWPEAPAACFRPYLLYPDMPREGVDRAAAYERKFPDPAQRKAIMDALAATAAEIGVDFDIGRAARIPNALPAQHLIARTPPGPMQERLVDAIYDAYWRRGKDIGAAETLVAAASAAGLSEAAAKSLLNEPMEATKAEADAMRRGGVDGAPTFIVNGRAGFAGALPPQKLRAAIEHAAKIADGAVSNGD